MVQALRNALVHESLRLSIEFELQWRSLRFRLKVLLIQNSFSHLHVVFSVNILPIFIGAKVLTCNSGLMGLIPTVLMHKLN